MGSLAGHVLPGSIFVFYGISWIALSFWLHLSTPAITGHTQTRKTTYTDYKREAKLGRVSYIPQPFCSKVPLEPLIKILLSCIGILCEAFADIRDGHFVWNVINISTGPLQSVSRLHHLTMYGAFLLSGLVDVIGLIVRIPRNMSKLFLSLALFIEGLLFWYHTHDKEHLSVALHSLLIIVIFIALFLSLVRVLQPCNVIINSLLGTMLLTQGTWFIHVGSILYGHHSHWSVSDEASSTNQIMFAVVIFNWHVLGNMFFTLLVYILMLAIFRGSIKYKHNKRGKGHRWTRIKEEESLIETKDTHKDTIL